jgi:ketosteroid isomerase-like protein
LELELVYVERKLVLLFVLYNKLLTMRVISLNRFKVGDHIKFSLTFLSSLFVLTSHAQGNSEILDAERKFSAMSMASGTKPAFVAFLDTSCIGFVKGKQINLYQRWLNGKETETKLDWQPEFSVMSSSGDLGVNTGPWQFYKNKKTDTVSASGYFTTVWKKNSNGEWKAILDFGSTGNGKEKKEVDLVNEIDMRAWNDHSPKTEIYNDTVLTRNFSKDGWLNISGRPVLKNSRQIYEEFEKFASIKFYPTGNFNSLSGDIRIFYGVAEMEGNKNHNYMQVRIWQNHKWQTLLLVIS